MVNRFGRRDPKTNVSSVALNMKNVAKPFEITEDPILFASTVSSPDAIDAAFKESVTLSEKAFAVGATAAMVTDDGSTGGVVTDDPCILLTASTEYAVVKRVKKKPPTTTMPILRICTTK